MTWEMARLEHILTRVAIDMDDLNIHDIDLKLKNHNFATNELNKD